MKSFNSLRAAMEWAEQVTPAGRWVNVSVSVRQFGEVAHWWLKTRNGGRARAYREF